MLWEDTLSPALRTLARRVAAAASYGAGAIGLLALLGWIIDNDALKTVASGTATMKFNTAVCVTLCAFALWCAARRPQQRWMHQVQAWAPVIASFIALLTLLQYVLGADFGIDELFVHDAASYAHAAPGRMAIPTIVGFALFAFAMRAALRDEGRWVQRIFLLTTIGGLVIATLAIIGYAYDLQILYQPLPQNSIALNTAIAFFFLFIGASALRPDLGWFALLEASTVTGIYARWLLPTIVLFPIVLGWAIFRFSQSYSLYTQESLALFALGSVLGLGAVTWGVGIVANRLGARLRLREKVLSTVIDTALDAFIMFDDEGRVMHWNPRAEAMFGYSYDEAFGGIFGEMVLPPALRERHNAGFAKFAATGENLVMRRRVQLNAIKKDGAEFPVELMIYPVHFDGGWVFCAFMKDLSELRQTEAQLRQAQKMEAVGQLTGGLAHDFNNLLTVMIATLDSLMTRVSADLRPRLEGALNAAERGAALTKQLLAYSRRQTLAPEAVDLNRIVEGLQDMLIGTLSGAIEVEYRLSEEACIAFADRAQLENALINLAINARDAMSTGGKLMIETGYSELDEAYAGVNSEVAPGLYAMLAVSDTGVGMSADVQEHAFEPFFTTKEFGKGSGLGLSMIYGFAKQSNGHVKIYSEIGHGTTVRLYLPFGGDKAAPYFAAISEAAPNEARGETVLVVEDDAAVRAVALTQLQELGYKTLHAANAAEALKIIEGDAKIDLLFTDVMMPGGMSGKQLAERAASLRPGLKTLYTSGYTSNSIVHDGRLDPDVHFLAKPYRRAELAAKLRQAIET